jgi:hypothetical protein
MTPHRSEAWEDLWNHTSYQKPTPKKIITYQLRKDIAWIVCDMLDVAKEQQHPDSYKTKEHFFFHNIDSIAGYLIRTREWENTWEILRKWAERYGLSIGDINAIILYKNAITQTKSDNAQEFFIKSYRTIQSIIQKQEKSFEEACKIYWQESWKKKYKSWKITRFDWLEANSIPFLLIMQIVGKYELGEENS